MRENDAFDVGTEREDSLRSCVAFRVEEDLTFHAETVDGETFSVPSSVIRDEMEILKGKYSSEYADFEDFRRTRNTERLRGIFASVAEDFLTFSEFPELIVSTFSELAGKGLEGLAQKLCSETVAKLARHHGCSVVFFSEKDVAAKPCPYCGREDAVHEDRSSGTYSCGNCGAELPIAEERMKTLLSMARGMTPDAGTLYLSEHIRPRMERPGTISPFPDRWGRNMKDIVAVRPGKNDYITVLAEGDREPVGMGSDVFACVKELEETGESEEKHDRAEYLRTVLKGRNREIAEEIIAQHPEETVLIIPDNEPLLRSTDILKQSGIDFLEELYDRALRAGWYTIRCGEEFPREVCPECHMKEYMSKYDDENHYKCWNCNIVWNADEVKLVTLFMNGAACMPWTPGIMGPSINYRGRRGECPWKGGDNEKEEA